MFEPVASERGETYRNLSRPQPDVSPRSAACIRASARTFLAARPRSSLPSYHLLRLRGTAGVTHHRAWKSNENPQQHRCTAGRREAGTSSQIHRGRIKGPGSISRWSNLRVRQPAHKGKRGYVYITQRPLALAAESPFSSDSRRQTAAHIPGPCTQRSRPAARSPPGASRERRDPRRAQPVTA